MAENLHHSESFPYSNPYSKRRSVFTLRAVLNDARPTVSIIGG